MRSLRTLPAAFGGRVQRSTAGIQRKCACGAIQTGSECTECKEKRLAAKPGPTGGRVATVPAIVSEVLGSPGQPLAEETREAMQLELGHDFSRVRVHADGKAAESAAAVDALAYTVGPHVVFGDGQFVPHTNAGKRLLAHELWHVVQGQPSKPPTSLSHVTDPSERQAEDIASRVMTRSSGERTVDRPFPSRVRQGVLQRLESRPQETPIKKFFIHFESGSVLAPEAAEEIKKANQLLLKGGALFSVRGGSSRFDDYLLTKIDTSASSSLPDAGELGAALQEAFNRVQIVCAALGGCGGTTRVEPTAADLTGNPQRFLEHEYDKSSHRAIRMMPFISKQSGDAVFGNFVEVTILRP